jgi:hypothetical protein
MADVTHLPYFTPGGERLVPVASFPSQFIAELAANALHTEGIPAIVLGANAAALGAPANGILGTQLHVPLTFLAHARELLADSSRPPPNAVPWTCPSCSERVPGNFDVCWNCGTARTGEPDPDFRSAITFNPLCEHCGYLLYGLPTHRCPECGKEFTPPPSSPPGTPVPTPAGPGPR